ncbi:hypothetical protein FNV43_RR23614 [Rhamnella rubrinervis]|uniref:RRM domain-containing protein n=1 Tax=Rhamnella rubrinervis TaxID=2594499 RepID=A0A8K0E452_9ROSA|nr:hypothetical protein FNV43_RR23614 [Rhamnella rubrinervis]
MVKPNKLRASLCAAITGEHGIISASAILRASAYMRNICLSEGIQSLKQSFHNASDEDEFSVLGPVVGKGETNIRKLMTEKPDHYRKLNSTIKASSRSSLPAKSIPKLKENFSELYNSSPTVFLKLENQKNVYGSDINNKSTSNFKKLKSICVKNLPSVLSLSQLKEALSVFGMISHASLRTKQDELDCCDVEFESVESSKRAISVGGITVKSYNLVICPLHCQETVTIRISNIGSGTTNSAIRSICKYYGTMEGLVRRKVDAVDAMFTVEDNAETQSILQKLKQTTVVDHKWSAQLHHTDSTPAGIINQDDGNFNLGVQISRNLADWNRQAVYVEDLEYLHKSLMHIEAHSDHQYYYREQ